MRTQPVGSGRLRGQRDRALDDSTAALGHFGEARGGLVDDTVVD